MAFKKKKKAFVFISGGVILRFSVILEVYCLLLYVDKFLFIFYLQGFQKEWTFVSGVVFFFHGGIFYFMLC